MKLLSIVFLSLAAFSQATINAPAVNMDSDGAAAVRLWMASQTTNAQTQLADPVSATDTTIRLASTQGIGANSMISIGSEHIAVTAKNGDTLTVARAQNGSTAAAYAAGTNVAEMKYRSFNNLGRQIIVETLRQIIRIAEAQKGQVAVDQAANEKAQTAVQ